MRMQRCSISAVLRVLRVIDEVAVEVLGDDPLDFGLHPRGHERREVANRNPVEHELLFEQAQRVQRGHAALRQLLGWRVTLEEAVAEPLLELVGSRAVGAARFGVLGFNGHFGPPRSQLGAVEPSLVARHVVADGVGELRGSRDHAREPHGRGHCDQHPDDLGLGRAGG